jgi:hypothetical protein
VGDVKPKIAIPEGKIPSGGQGVAEELTLFIKRLREAGLVTNLIDAREAGIVRLIWP